MKINPDKFFRTVASPKRPAIEVNGFEKHEASPLLSDHSQEHRLLMLAKIHALIAWAAERSNLTINNFHKN